MGGDGAQTGRPEKELLKRGMEMQFFNQELGIWEQKGKVAKERQRGCSEVAGVLDSRG